MEPREPIPDIESFESLRFRKSRARGQLSFENVFHANLEIFAYSRVGDYKDLRFGRILGFVPEKDHCTGKPIA